MARVSIGGHDFHSYYDPEIKESRNYVDGALVDEDEYNDLKAAPEQREDLTEYDLIDYIAAAALLEELK